MTTGGVGPSERAVRRLARDADEPAWLLAMRLEGLRQFDARALPRLGLDPVALALDAIDHGRRSGVPASMLPADDEPTSAELRRQGVIVEPLDVAVREHPDLVRSHLGSVVPAADHPMAALTAAAWTGGTFIHVPAGVEIAVPIQATSRGRVATLGRFERTLVVAGEGSVVHYIEGCSAPVYTADPLRSTVVEVVVESGARATHTTIQNWSANVTTLAIKRARVGAAGQMEWIDGNLGSRRTLTYPSVALLGPKATGAVRSVTLADAGQDQRIGARLLHGATETTSEVEAKVVANRGGRCHHRGLVRAADGVTGMRSEVACDALILDDLSGVEAELRRQIGDAEARIEERATAAGLDEERLRYLASRGLSAPQAGGLLVNGFIEPVTRRLPVEFAVDWNRLVELQLEGSVG